MDKSEDNKVRKRQRINSELIYCCSSFPCPQFRTNQIHKALFTIPSKREQITKKRRNLIVV